MGRSAAVGRFERATLEVDTNRRSGRATYMMTFRGSLGLVAIFGLFSMAAASPWFYHGLEGPSFTEKNTTSSGLEIRSYPESYWTATTVTGKNMDSAGSEARDLFARRTSRTTFTCPRSSSPIRP